MIISASQPYFAPYPGFFYKAFCSDVLVLLDTVQFPRGTTWMTRNRFKNDQGTLWMTIPVKKKGLGLQRIDQVEIFRDGRWPRKYLRSLETTYSDAPWFPDHFDFIRDLFFPGFVRLVDMNTTIIRYIADLLKVKAKIILLSDLGIEESGDLLLIRICQALGATRFLAQEPAKKYIRGESFENERVQLEFIKPPVPVYPQLWGGFLPNLSIFDLIFCCGPKASDIING